MPDMNMMRPQPDDREAAMARADLYKLANYSTKLFKMIQDGDQLEGWVQAKITKAADYVASVYHFMEYEMKFSEYGSKLENSDVYTESVKKEFKRKLTEAKAKLEKLKEKNIKDLDEGWEDMMKANKERGKEKGTGKFDVKKTSTGTQYTRKSSTFTDGGDDRDVKKAKKASKVKEGFPTVADAKSRSEKEKTTGKFDKKEIKPGVTQYTRKSSTFTDGGDDKDVKKAKQKARKTDEGIADVAKKAVGAVKKVGAKALDKLGHGSDEDMLKDLQRKMGATGSQVHGKKSMAVKNEASINELSGKTLRSYQDKARMKSGGAKSMADLHREVGDKKGAAEYDKVAAKRDAGIKKAASKDKEANALRKHFGMKEAAKPDFLDMDKDGNKKEPMKKAVADKKKNPFAKK